jgi:HK97 family phage prohead protease
VSPQTKTEIRTFAAKLEARDLDSLQFRLDGYASVTGVEYDMGGGNSEIVRRGAFTKTLASQPKVKLTINHGQSGSGLPLALTTIPSGQIGHLSLSEDDKGLHVIAQLDREDDEAKTLMRRISTGIVSEMSFAFRVLDDDYNGSLRTIKSVSLDRGDVSVVASGASPTTSVTARSRQGRAGYPLSLVQARAEALRLGGKPISRDRRVRILNEAGRQTPARNPTMAQARIIADGLRARQR